MYGNSGEIAPWPGIKMRECGDNVYELITPIDIKNLMQYVIFNDTYEQVPNSAHKGFTLINNRIYDSEGYTSEIE